MEKEVKKSNKGLYAIITILCIAVLGLGGFIVYKEFIEKDKDEKECTCTKCVTNDNITKNDEETNTEVSKQSCFDSNNFDENKIINKKENTKYSLPKSSSIYMPLITASIDSKNSKSVIISVPDWRDYGKYVNIDSNESSVKSYTISFSKTVKDVVLHEGWQSFGREVLYVLLEDGTVEYVPVAKEFSDSKSINTTLTSAGRIDEVKDIVYLVEGASVNEMGNGLGEVYGIKEDGTIYALTNYVQISY